MSFASDKLYNGYLRRKMPTIATKVKVREIMVHLPCLTSQDRENIEAKREICGNFDSMVLLLDCLKRRENWPEQFVEALEACEQTALAAEIRDEYNKLKGPNNSNPSSPPTTVVRAHVHPAPSASQLSTPESAVNNPAAVAPSSEESAPPQPAEESAPPQPSEESAPPQPAEESAPPQPSEESAPTQPAEESAPPEPSEESAPPQPSEESAPPQPSEESAPPQPAEESAPPQLSEESAPPQPAEESAPPQLSEESAPPQPAEESAPPQLSEESAPPQPAEESAPPQLSEESAPPQPAEESALPQPVEESAPPQPAEELAPPQPAEELAPPQPAEESAPTQPAEESAPPQPAEESAPPQPAEESAPPQPAEAPVSPPEPVPEPPQPAQNEVAAPPSTPPPSPATQHTQTTATPPPQREINSHLEPEENSESDLQDGVIPDQVRAGHSGTAPQDSLPAGQCETDVASRPDPLQKTTETTKSSPPQSPSPTQMNSDVTDGSSFLMKTLERPPVQDTTPPVDIKPAAVLQPEETSGAPAAQVVESSLQTATAAITSTLPGAAEMDASVCTESNVCVSNGSPNIPESSSPLQPCSGHSECLGESEAESDTVTSAHPPACSAAISTTVTTASALPCQENGFALNHNEPEENHYESPSQVLEVLENMVHVAKEPSHLNLDGQSSTPQAQIVNGEAAKEIPSAPPLTNNASDTVLRVDALSSENQQPSEPAAAVVSPEPKTLQDSQEKSASRTLPTNTKYILTAAGVGACALLMAWRFKN